MPASTARAGLVLLAPLLMASAALLPTPVTPGEEPLHARPDAAGEALHAPPRTGPVGRGFEEPAGRFGRGHRGVDILLPPGAPVRAAADGTVAFAGAVAGARFVTLAHDGPRGPFETTYGFLARIDVRRGDRVVAGDVIGAAGAGHPGRHGPGLHVGMRRDGRYVDPRLLLGLAHAGGPGLASLGPLPGR